MSNDIRKQKLHERETEAYKNFLIIAKRIKAIEYDKKWVISPDPSDPLRKYIFERETPWFKLRVVLRSKEYQHQWQENTSYEQRYDYKFYIGFQGFFADKTGDITLTSSLKVRPRITKKLIALMNDTLIPNVYKEVMKCDEQFNKTHNQQKYFNSQLAKFGIKPTPQGNGQIELKGLLPIPFNAQAKIGNDFVQIQGDVPFNIFEKMCKQMGWIK